MGIFSLIFSVVFILSFLWGHQGCQGAKIKRDLTGNALQFHPRPGKWNLNWWLRSQDCNTLTRSQTPLMLWRRRIIHLSMVYSLTAEDPAAGSTNVSPLYRCNRDRRRDSNEWTDKGCRQAHPDVSHMNWTHESGFVASRSPVPSSIICTGSDLSIFQRHYDPNEKYLHSSLKSLYTKKSWSTIKNKPQKYTVCISFSTVANRINHNSLYTAMCVVYVMILIFKKLYLSFVWTYLYPLNIWISPPQPAAARTARGHGGNANVSNTQWSNHENIQQKRWPASPEKRVWELKNSCCPSSVRT